MVYIESLCFFIIRLKIIQIIWKMQNEKVSKKWTKSSYLVIAIFQISIQIPKRSKCEIAPPETQIDVHCKQPRFENGPCCARSIRRDVSLVLCRQTFPCSSYNALLARGQGPDSAETSPFTSIRDARKNYLCRVTSL